MILFYVYFAPFGKQDTAGEAIESVISLCLRTEPANRPNCDRINSYLTDLSEIIAEQHKEQQPPLTPTNFISTIDDSMSTISSTYL